MNRREFCAGLGSMMFAGMANRRVVAEEMKNRPAHADPDPEGGYTLKPPRQFLFLDYRHINPGDLRWFSPEGRQLPVAGPPEPPVKALAGADDGSKALVKEMVQEPGDYIVGSSFHPIDRMDDMYQSLGRFHTCWFVRFS